MVRISDIKYLIISVIGSHADESKNEIFYRKIQDITNVDFTFWLMKSHKSKPELVNNLCLRAKSENTDCYSVFIEPSSKKGAIPTKSAFPAKEYSKDKISWLNLPYELSPVTGKLPAYGLVLNHLELINDKIDLWSYADFFNQNSPIKITRGASIICAIKKDILSQAGKIKSRFRKVVAIGKLREPFCVYLR